MENIAFENLPDDKDTLQKMVVDYHFEIQRLREQVKLFQQKRFGRKSEKTDAQQLSLFDENIETEEAASETVTIKNHVRKKQNRALPKSLPREQKIYDLEDSEKICACGHELHKIGDDKYEQLEYIPAQIKVIEHIKFKYACKSCEEGIKTASMPKQPIPKSIATPGLLAQTITAKYVDHLPLYRQESILTRIGVTLPRATMSNWIFKCSDLLTPLVDLLKTNIIEESYACADETTVNVLSEKENRTHSYMWVFMAGPSGKQSVVFEYHPSRAGTIPTKFFEGFSGYLQTDAYQGYNGLCAKAEITSVGCWAHSRRKFFEITKISKKAGSAHIGVKFINSLYEIERKAKEQNLNFDQIKEIREEKSNPILEEFKIWLDKTISRVPPKSALGVALKYTINNWDVLNNYCLDGRISIDNNGIERMIKPFACGRKNWLFQGNTKGANASAILYSLVQTCKINKIDPYKYFRYVLTEFPNKKENEDLRKYLPQNCDLS